MINDNVNELKVRIDQINRKIDEGFLSEALQEFVQIDRELSSANADINVISQNNEIAEFYASYAYFLFSISEYDSFFQEYLKAQAWGYSSDKKRTFLYDAFVEPNLIEFKKNYHANRKLLNFDIQVDFEELPFWLITTGKKNEYYLYDKKMNFLGEKVMLEFERPGNKIENVESDIFLVNDGSWRDLLIGLECINKTSKSLYVFEKNGTKLLSCLQGVEISADFSSKVVVFTQWEHMKEFFITHNASFPHSYIGDSDYKMRYIELKKEIHQYRLSKDGRFGNSVLLSICIPSYNRGHRAYENVLNCLRSEFDEEIEVVVSNNGTQNDTKVYYEKINQIADSRLTYFSFEENQGMALNICKVAEIASGEYLLMLSDEDLVDVSKLGNLLFILRENHKNDVGLVRVKSDNQGIVPYVGIINPGIEAFRAFMLTSNYLSGNIYRKSNLLEYNLIEFIKNNLENETCTYYPHMVWEIMLLEHTKVLGLDLVLINEGKAEKTEFDYAAIGETIQKQIPYYATFEGRLGQHIGFFEILQNLEITDDFDIFRELYKKLCAKTLFLVSLSIRVYYKTTDTNNYTLMEDAYMKCLEYLRKMFYGRKNKYKYKYTDDQKEIRQYYLKFKEMIK